MYTFLYRKIEYLDKDAFASPIYKRSLYPGKVGEVKQTTYHFVDLIRFISTIGIAFMHTDIPFATHSPNAVIHSINHIEYYFWLKNICKFATICYFLIAGFLLSDKITDNNHFKYYMRRLNVIARPYILALVIFIVVLLVYTYGFAKPKLELHYLGGLVKYAMFYTAFWYIPNYLLCLLIIVSCSKYIGSVYFGGFWLLVTLVNTYFTVYSPVHNSSHTTALFGFVFYMWLGVYIKKAGLISKIKRISPVIWGIIALLVLLFSNWETWYLFNYTHTSDSLNTLRISNQLYSLAVFAFLVSCCNKAPNFGIFNPRKETYGIYLYHSFFIFFAIPALEALISYQFGISFFSYNIYKIIIIVTVNFMICYFASTALVKLLLRSKLAYLPPL